MWLCVRDNVPFLLVPSLEEARAVIGASPDTQPMESDLDGRLYVDSDTAECYMCAVEIQDMEVRSTYAVALDTDGAVMGWASGILRLAEDLAEEDPEWIGRTSALVVVPVRRGAPARDRPSA